MTFGGRAHGPALSVYKATEALPKVEGVWADDADAAVGVAIPTRIAEGCGREGDAEFAGGAAEGSGGGFGAGIHAVAQS